MKFMRWARKKEYHNTNAFEDFELVRTPKEVIWLEEDELEKIEMCQPEQKHLKRTKKLFLFMIFTGQRYGDYKNLKKRHIVVNPDGMMDWELYQRKGSKTTKIIIPLIDRAIDILKEFGFDEADIDDYLLPVPCNQFLNRQIKDLCEFAGIDSPITIIKTVGNQRIEENFKKFEVVSCHTSRKTWVSLSMVHGLGMEYITSVTGHQQIKTLKKHYLGLSEKARRQAINNAWGNKQ
jgi:integrase